MVRERTVTISFVPQQAVAFTVYKCTVLKCQYQYFSVSIGQGNVQLERHSFCPRIRKIPTAFLQILVLQTLFISNSYFNSVVEGKLNTE